MPVGLLLVSHNRIGQDLLATATAMLGRSPMRTAHLAVSQSGDPDALFQRATELCTELDDGDGVLVLTDMFGSTPSNIATRLLHEPRCKVVSGMNLPMLVRVMNYPQLALPELINKALSGGHDGIILCDPGE